MNKFTADFHQGVFPGFTVTTPYQKIIDNFWFSKDIPFIETDFNIDVASTYRWLVENDHLFEKRYTQVNRMSFAKDHGYEWFIDTHSSDWSNLDVIGEDYKRQPLVDGGEIQPETSRPTRNPDVLSDLRMQLDTHCLPINRIVIFRLAPGGWVQPHVDKKIDGIPSMNHVWMPLHDFNYSLKVYPYGYVPHKTGRAYLLNNNDYIHSVINTDDLPRYVAIMKIDYQNIPDSSWQRIQKSLQQQWFK